MKPTRLALISVILIATCLLTWSYVDEPVDTQVDREIPPVESGTRHPAADAKPTGVDTARQRVADAKLVLQTVVFQRESAEKDLLQAEYAVEELERFIEDIESRGEDPADYVDEGLAKFQPAFYAYQDAVDRLELAETMEQDAARELAEAEGQLARALAQ